jgi:hypothetical protein
MKKIYFALLAVLGLSMNAEAQRNIKLSVTVFKPAVDTNITTSSTQYPIYVLQNISSTTADSVAKGDSIYIQSPVNTSTQVTIFIPGGSIKKDSFFVISNTTITGGYTVPFANIKTLWNTSTLAYVNAPFTANTRYLWYAYMDTVKKGPGNPAIATVNKAADTQVVWINKTTAINETAAFDKTIRTFPNPAVRDLNFEVALGANVAFTATILDMTGRVVMTEEMTAQEAGKQTFSMNLAAVSNGTYILHVRAGEKAIIAPFNVQK